MHHGTQIDLQYSLMRFVLQKGIDGFKPKASGAFQKNRFVMEPVVIVVRKEIRG